MGDGEESEVLFLATISINTGRMSTKDILFIK